MKKGIQRLWLAIEDTVRGVLLVIRYPRTLRMARVNLGAWFFALMFAVFGVMLNIQNSGSPFGLWFNAAIGVIDIYMLQRSYLGYRWVRGRRARRRA
jgi:hypothetical protein